jgi:ferritin-like metal-binding protein YciE
MKLATLEDLFVQELKDLYSAETQITKALPRMAKAASSPELKNAFQEHLDVTRTQVQRLEQIFQELGASPRGKKCVGMEGLIEEGKELMSNDNADDMVIDAALLAAAQKIEHYEMAAYGTACAFAKLLGQEEAADLLAQTLEEEKETDQKLSMIAEESVNVQAASGMNGDEDEDEDEE